MRRGTVVLGCFSLLAALSLPAPARADRAHPTAAELDRASDQFKKGKAFHAKNKLDDAYRAYSEAWKLHESPDIAANLASVELALGKKRDAAEHFQFALKRLLAGTSAEQKAKLEQGFDKAKHDVATVHVVLVPDGAELRIDDVAAGKAPFDADLFVEPGEHRLSAAAAGYAPWNGTLSAKKGETHSVTIELVAETKAAPPPAPSADPPAKSGPPVSLPPDKPATTRSSPVPAYVALGAGIVGLGAGVGFLLAASAKDSKKDQLLADIPGTNKCGPGTTAKSDCDQVSSLADDAKRFRTFGYVGFGVAIAGGVATYLLWPRSSEPSAAAAVIPSFDRHGTSLQFRGRF